MRKKTVGKLVSELSLKTPDSLDPIEIQRATEQEYINELIWCVKHALKKETCRDACPAHCDERIALHGDFFVEALVKKEKILVNTFRNFFIPRTTCPTPCYDQTVYRYDAQKEEIEFLWVIPDKETCEVFRENKHIIVPEEQALLRNILSFYDGTLFKRAKKYNGEQLIAGVALKEK